MDVETLDVLFWGIYNVSLFLWHRHFYSAGRYQATTTNAFAIGGATILGLIGLIGLIDVNTPSEAAGLFVIALAIGMLSIPPAWVTKKKAKHHVH